MQGSPHVKRVLEAMTIMRARLRPDVLNMPLISLTVLIPKQATIIRFETRLKYEPRSSPGNALCIRRRDLIGTYDELVDPVQLG